MVGSLAEIDTTKFGFQLSGQPLSRPPVPGTSVELPPVIASASALWGHILHDWDLAQKRLLLKRAHDALPQGGALIIYDAIIDDQRRENAFGLLMSLNMLIETRGGFDYTGADC